MNNIFNEMKYPSLVNVSKEYYRLLLILGSLNPLKLKILLILAHLSPKRLTATQITLLLGYSANSRVIYRGVLDELHQANFILLDKISRKKYSIQLNLENPSMYTLLNLCNEYGMEYSDNLHTILEEQ